MAKKRRPNESSGGVPAETEKAPSDGDRPSEGAVEADVTSPLNVVVLQEKGGSEPFTVWFNSLRDKEAKQRVLARLAVVRRGSLGSTRSVGDGVIELKISYGPGYRVYFGRKGDTLVVLIVGGDKSSQQSDIDRAKELWKLYKDEIENI